jgi:TP901 family phage tail tape measure protein
VAERTIKAIITATATGLISEFNKASAATKAFGRDLADQQANLDNIGNSLLGIGVAAAAGLAGAAKAAIDWESAWAGVSKTVDASADELSKLEDELRQMARTLPASHTEIAAVAEAAGQLGVRTEDIASFTKTMIDLGETTNLSADEAATSLAQFMNVMGTAPEMVDELGSTIVALGNSGASTEKQIVEMAQRIAGAGAQVGLTETQVLAFASSLASVGIDAEAGGTAISTSFLKIEQAVRGGGRELEVLADTAGVTSEEFAHAFEEDAAGAMEAFILGLGRTQEAGGDTTAILKELGITGIREGDALRRLASSGDLLTKSLVDANTAWSENSALAEEAAKRYATTEAQVQIAFNNIQDAAIEAGAVLLPIIADMAKAIGELAQWFGDLPDPVKNAGVAIAGIVASVGLLGGGALKAISGVSSLMSSIDGLRNSGGKAGPVIGRLAKSVGVLGGALIAAQIAGVIGKATGAINEFTPSIEKAADALIKVGQANDGKSLDELFTFAEGGAGGPPTNQILGLADAMKRVTENNAGDAFQGFIANLFQGTTIVQDAAKTFGELDRQLGQMSFDEASKAFEEIRKKAVDQGIPMENLIKLFPEYAERVRKAGDEQKHTYRSAEELTDAMGGKLPPALAKTTKELDKQSVATLKGVDNHLALKSATFNLESAQAKLGEETDKMIASLGSLTDVAIDAEEATIGFEASIDDLAEITKEATEAGDKHAKSLDADTKSGRTNRSAVIDSIKALNGKTEATFKDDVATQGLDKATKNASKSLEQGKEDIRDAGRAAGLSEKEINKMIDEMVKTPEEMETEFSTPGMRDAQEKIKQLEERIKDLEGKGVSVTTDFRVSGQVVNFETGKTNKIGNKTVNMDGSWHEGGYTGPGGMFEDAGRVHKGEVVFDQAAVSAAGGPDALDQFRVDLRTGRTRLPRGYAYGGIAGRPRTLAGRRSTLGGRPTEEEEITVHGKTLGGLVGAQGLVDGYANAAAAYGEKIMTQIAKEYVKRAEEALSGDGGVHGSWSKIDVNNPHGYTTYRGGRFTNLFAKNLQRAEEKAGQSIRVFQGGWRPATSYSGTSHAGDAVDLQVSSALIRALRSVGIPAWDRTGRGPWAPHTHAIPLPGAGYPAGSAVWQGQDYKRGGDGLGLGGLVKGYSPNKTADNIPLWGTAGEYMQPVDSVNHYGTEFMDAVRRKQFPREVINNRLAPNLAAASLGPWVSQSGTAPNLEIHMDGNFGWDPDRIARKAADRLNDAMIKVGMTAAMP